MGPQGAVPEWGRQIGVSKWSDGQMEASMNKK